MNKEEKLRHFVNSYIDDVLIFVGIFLLNLSIYLFSIPVGIGFTGVTLIVLGILFTIYPIKLKAKREKR